MNVQTSSHIDGTAFIHQRASLPSLEIGFMLQLDGSCWYRDLSLSQIRHGHTSLSVNLQRCSSKCMSAKWYVYLPVRLSLRQAVRSSSSPSVVGGVSLFLPHLHLPFYLTGQSAIQHHRPAPDWSQSLSHTNKPYQYLIQLERDHDRENEGEGTRDCVRTWCFSCLQNISSVYSWLKQVNQIQLQRGFTICTAYNTFYP